MPDLYKGPYGSYVSQQSANGKINTTMANIMQDNFRMLLSLIPDPAVDPAIATNYAPDFDAIPAHVADKLRKEIIRVREMSITSLVTTTGGVL